MAGAMIGGLFIGVVESLSGLYLGRVAGADRHLRNVHSGVAVPSERTVRSPGMKAYAPIVAISALMALVPFVTASNTVLNFLVMALLIALAGQGWNILGGYGGQYSFGHAAFFGTGAYVTAVLQVRYGLNAWICFVARHRRGRSGRGGDRRSQLPFRSAWLVFRARYAGVCRGAPDCRQRHTHHRGRRRHLDQARLAARGVSVPEPSAVLLDLLALVFASLLLTRAIEHSRFGAYLVALRENEDARQGARRRYDFGEASCDDGVRRDHRSSRRLLRAIFPVRRTPGLPMGLGFPSRRYWRRSLVVFGQSLARCSARWW